MISKKFLKNSLIYTVAGALPMASALILLPFYISYLPMEMYGAFSLCLAFSILVQIVVTYSFDTSIYIHYHEYKNDPAKLATFISAAFLFILGLGFTVSLLFTLIGEWVFSLFSLNEQLSFYPYGLISVALGVFQAVVKVHGNLLQTREKPEPFLWSNIFLFSLIALTTIAGLHFYPNSLWGPLGGRLLAAFATGVWALSRVFNEFGFHWVSPWKDTASRFNAYTFVYQVQQWVINYIDRFLILFFMPLATVGVYDFAIKCLVPIELMLNGLNASINPRVIKLINEQPIKGATQETNRYFYGLISVVMLLVCLAILTLPFFVKWFIPDTPYAAALHVVPFIAVLFMFKAIRLYYVIPYSVLKRMKELTLLNFVVALTKIGAMVLFIARWQLYGVVASAAFASLLELILLGYYLRGYFTTQFNIVKLMGVPFLLLITIVLGELLIESSLNSWMHVGYLAFCGLLLLTAYRKEISLLNPFKLIR